MGIIVNNQNQENKKTVHYNLVDSKNLLLIFTRNPVLGKCKTRLAAKVGDEAALEIYKFLLQHTVSFTQNLNAVKQVFYSEDIWENDIWNSMFFDKKLQVGADLGIRMANAFQDGFTSGFEKIIVIGSDMYDLSQNDIEAAFTSLEKNDFVIGPADDGGYYLLGMKKFNAALFQNKKWGTSSVLESTVQNLEGEKLELLPIRNDIDVYEDIENQKVFYPFIKHMKA
ncbi:TIGR04282 family arsenosugar biosynthesis glycosyltransferase [Aurantibacter crassamenti]|uniref:TIGR04282 family arsenosugar biosynthesis glycosyltransferase n=1 Tax=Aurantibacter crassamenti TaxID=1837375 RepID=UPI00193981C1|nr:TIGR04282 family arsenosugar biosynthesis glycosyltransferase [Aurantibacter crassamenti]MBM1104706.1 TIGR04282 family arsenosugar biosynthesis glycosyltransferase [Aurantibacter crassamenti]